MTGRSFVLRFTQAAERDLEEIADYIARDNPKRALSFVRELREACGILATAPYAFAPPPRYRAQGVRMRVHKSYLIFYVVSAETVDFIHILHGQRNYAAILFPDEP